MSNVVQMKPAQHSVQVPDFIKREDIEKMDDDTLDALIAAIRTRRLLNVEVYKRTKVERAAVNDAQVKAKIDKKIDQIMRKLKAVDTHVEMLEKYIAELRGLRLQADLPLM